VQFVLMIHQGTTPLPGTDAWETLPEAEQKAVYADYAALNDTPGVSPGLPLGLPADARTVRVADGATAVTEGTYNQAADAVGGYVVVEAEGIDDAIAIAARIPAARHGGAVEVRPVATYW
jgi:hypothetical protein